MPILHEIIKWAPSLPLWQQDAIARIYLQESLTDQDHVDLFAFLKAEHGIPDIEQRAARVLVAGDLAVPRNPEANVQLIEIKNLVNVNALAAGQRLPIGQTGLTVIYGENGAGKSGYARVLKKACRARDQREPILSNANLPRGSESGPASATFELMVDGSPLSVDWRDGTDAPEQLSAIAIFDSHCARAYVDNQGDFAYSPYGLDILERLVKVCIRLRDMATQEQQQATPNLEPLRELAQMPTSVGKLLASLSAQTTSGDIEALARFGDDHRSSLENLQKALAEPDPQAKAKTLRNRAQRFERLIRRIGDSTAFLDDARVASLQEITDQSVAAREAARIAAEDFAGSARLLPGSGGPVWRQLFEAARAYAAESHAEHVFPRLGVGALCPLCQQTLGNEAAARLESFDDWVKGTTDVKAKEAEDALSAARRTLETADLDLELDDALLDELSSSQTSLAVACTEYQGLLTARHAHAMKAASLNEDWSRVPPLTGDPRGAIREVVQNLTAEANVLESAADEEHKATLRAEAAELESRRRLSELKPIVLDAVMKMDLVERLKRCIDSTAHTGISRKSTELCKTVATAQLAAALNAEFTKLNVHELQVAMKPESPKGKTQFKLVLELPGGRSPGHVLSEGEQRALAIACFLAEVNIGKAKGGIVFDDPVSSLDHVRRILVAERLAEEALHRQVIVFTHDVYFLCVLQQAAESMRADALVQRVHRTPHGFGARSDTLPFSAMSTSKRIGALRQRHAAVARAHKVGDEDEARRLTFATYVDLRIAWERGVEEVLLAETVTRFTEGVSTKKLRMVVVDDSDYAAIEAGMTKSSRFGPHDPAVAAQLPRPHPDELARDIEALESWRKAVVARRTEVEAKRR